MPACCSESAETATIAALSRKEARQAGGPSFREEALQEAPRLYFSDSTDLEKAVIIPIFRHKSWSLPDLPLWTTAARERRWPRPEGCASAASGVSRTREVAVSTADVLLASWPLWPRSIARCSCRRSRRTHPIQARAQHSVQATCPDPATSRSRLHSRHISVVCSRSPPWRCRQSFRFSSICSVDAESSGSSDWQHHANGIRSLRSGFAAAFAFSIFCA
jgi:hypothetical protein